MEKTTSDPNPVLGRTVEPFHLALARVPRFVGTVPALALAGTSGIVVWLLHAWQGVMTGGSILGATVLAGTIVATARATAAGRDEITIEASDVRDPSDGDGRGGLWGGWSITSLLGFVLVAAIAAAPTILVTAFAASRAWATIALLWACAYVPAAAMLVSYSGAAGALNVIGLVRIVGAAPRAYVLTTIALAVVAAVASVIETLVVSLPLGSLWVSLDRAFECVLLGRVLGVFMREHAEELF